MIWKKVRNNYEVSDCGLVRRAMDSPCEWPATNTKPGRECKFYKTPDGYLKTGLRIDGKTKVFSVHRLVAEAFMGTCPVGCEVNHKDGNKENNCLKNLEYVSHASNMRHASRLELWKNSGYRGKSQWKAVLDDDAVREIRASRGIVTRAVLAAKFCVCKTTITRVQRGQCWRHVA